VLIKLFDWSTCGLLTAAGMLVYNCRRRWRFQLVSPSTTQIDDE
jgi:hypothetical protein